MTHVPKWVAPGAELAVLNSSVYPRYSGQILRIKSVLGDGRFRVSGDPDLWVAEENGLAQISSLFARLIHNRAEFLNEEVSEKFTRQMKILEARKALLAFSRDLSRLLSEENSLSDARILEIYGHLPREIRKILE